ncbi:MAG: cupredoxin family copper-binding protein [Thaumarchaeota archaeon]|nr:cupredoxin family copper-binding protein [Nitrososphaerota archaeon]
MKSPEVLVPFLGLLYLVLVFLYVMISTNFAPFSLIFVPFMVLFLASAYGVWRRKKIGYVGSTVVSGVFLVLEGTQIFEALGAVTIPGEFFSVLTAFPVLLAIFVYSVLGLRRVWGKTTASTPVRMIPASSLVVLLILGFIIGGAVVGSIAASTETRLLSSSGGGDITIVQGAGSQNNPQFYSPSSFTVKAGTTVTWVNHDGTAHTVTSKGSSLFDSGNILTGGSFSYTFTHAGTYQYYCTIHPWMTGMVVVTAA